MNAQKRFLLLGVVSACGLLFQGCEGGLASDPSMNLTGTEEEPLTSGPANTPSCASPKVLICHIPPGNPANAHSICVGAPAVKAHVTHHGDGLGACRPLASDAGVPVSPPPPMPPPAIDAGPTCKGVSVACTNSAQCCAAMTCLQGEGVCGPLIQ